MDMCWKMNFLTFMNKLVAKYWVKSCKEGTWTPVYVISGVALGPRGDFCQPTLAHTMGTAYVIAACRNSK